MARKRIIDPEFWSDEKVGTLSLISRLMFIGIWNFSDDEGLVRFNEQFIKANIFPYDSFSAKDIRKGMDDLVQKEFVFEYEGGLTNQKYAYIINFHSHQRIDKPQPSKLPPPSIQNPKVKAMYLKRDDHTCHLCRESVDLIARHDLPKSKAPSLDHIIPRIKGGTDYPTNIKIAHISCNKSKKDIDLDKFQEQFIEPFQESLLPNTTEYNSSEANKKEEKQRRSAREFEEIWSKYPKKLGKDDAFEKFKKQVITEKDFEDIKNALENFLKSDQCRGDPQYIPHGSTWFNKRWRDWIIYKKSLSGSQAERDQWKIKADKNCTNCRGDGSIYAPGSGQYGKCGCVKV